MTTDVYRLTAAFVFHLRLHSVVLTQNKTSGGFFTVVSIDWCVCCSLGGVVVPTPCETHSAVIFPQTI